MRPARLGKRPIVFFVFGLGVIAAAVYLAFELGRYQGGYSALDQRRETDALRQIIDRQTAEADELRRQITVLQTSREIDQATYAQVENDLSQLQLRIQAQEEELAFYQGIISPEDGYAGLRVQTVNLTRAELELHYLLRLVLVQAMSHDQRVSGVIRLNIDGTRNGEPARLGTDELLADGESSDIPYEFRYFQGLQRELVLPADFEPSRVNVEIWPRESGGQRILHSYDWTAVTGGSAPQITTPG